MFRRKFIKNSLVGIPIILLSPSVLATSCSREDDSQPNGKTVIVIGAGISGLSAAKKLKEKGFTVILLESQEKVGGRVRTNRSLGIPFDEGASWIHGPNGNPISGIASQAGVTTFLTDDNSLEVFDIDGSAYTDAIITASENEYNSEFATVLKNGTLSQSFETVFNSLYPGKSNDRHWKYMMSAYTEFDYGGDISELSSLYLEDDEKFNGQDVIVTNGYDKVADYLASGLDIRLNTRVSAVNYSGTKVGIETNKQNYEADYVIVTVPLGVLKNNRIVFTPNLPNAKTTAISKTKMGTVNKFLLVWDTAFWDTSLQYIGFTPETKGKFNYFLNLKKYSSSNALMTFSYGNYANLTESMSDSQIIDEIMLHLKAIYGNSIPLPKQMLRTKWKQNENSFGSYSFATNGTTSADFDELANEVGNKLFFAGEHTEKDYRGTVHGAYLSGIREAEKIIDLQ